MALVTITSYTAEHTAPSYLESLPAELFNEIVISRSSTHQAMTSLKNIGVTSKQHRVLIKRMFENDIALEQSLAALSKLTSNRSRTLSLLRSYRFITEQQQDSVISKLARSDKLFTKECEEKEKDERNFHETVESSAEKIKAYICGRWVLRQYEQEFRNLVAKIKEYLTRGVTLEKHTLLNELLIDASMLGETGLVELLLMYLSIDVNAANKYINRALVNAAAGGYEKIVELLLAHPKVEVNVENKFGTTALMCAAGKGNEKIVELLLAHPEIDVDVQDAYGNTALDDAKSRRHIKVVALLEAHKTQQKGASLFVALRKRFFWLCKAAYIQLRYL